MFYYVGIYLRHLMNLGLCDELLQRERDYFLCFWLFDLQSEYKSYYKIAQCSCKVLAMYSTGNIDIVLIHLVVSYKGLRHLCMLYIWWGWLHPLYIVIMVQVGIKSACLLNISNIFLKNIQLSTASVEVSFLNC